jgi:hypothetical protein
MRAHIPNLFSQICFSFFLLFLLFLFFFFFHFIYFFFPSSSSSYSSSSPSSYSYSFSSSSSGAKTPIFQYIALINILFPLITILDTANPIHYFHFLHVISYVIFPSVLPSPFWSYWLWFPLTYFLHHSLFRHSM